ncbi:MAG: hypothetical protein KGI35_13890, partial [Burkholderiales bacterium]|nr:hypothetical protein [Burkholderiales bacterium]
VRDAAGEPAGALAALDSIQLDAATRAPMMLRAQALLDLERKAAKPDIAVLRASVETLQSWVSDHANDASAWSLLGETAEAAGLHLRALRAGAEARAALGDLGGAIDRLRAAQTAARGSDGSDFIEASIVDARLRELQSQRRELESDARNGRGPGFDAGAAPRAADFRR